MGFRLDTLCLKLEGRGAVLRSGEVHAAQQGVVVGVEHALVDVLDLAGHLVRCEAFQRGGGMG